MDLLASLAERLRSALRSSDAPAEPVTIGDIYQRLIPYRSVRSELGVLEFAAYEHALLRLLAGEGRHVRVQEPRALEEIQRELASVSPILGIYRDYSEAAVEVGYGAAAKSAPSAAGAPAHPNPSTPTPAPDRPAPTPAAPPPVASAPSPRAPYAAACRKCKEPLPPIDSIRFCPYCGENQGPKPCAECGTPIEGGWSFCIRCGSPRSPA